MIKERLNGYWPLFKWSVGIALPLLIAIGTVLVTSIMSTMNQANIAIDIARQHGGEIQMLREEVQYLTRNLLSMTDDRFRGIDAVQMEEELMLRMELMEKDLKLHIRSECGAR